MKETIEQKEDFVNLVKIIEKSLRSIKDEWKFLILVFIPWALYLILLELNLLRLELTIASIFSITPPILPLVGSELFISNIKIDKWASQLEYALKAKDKTVIENVIKNMLATQIFSFGVIVYYFFIYSLYSGKKLKRVDFIFPILLAFFFSLLIGYISKIQYLIVSLFSLILALVIPIRNDGFSFIDSFRESFKRFKENWFELILILLIVLGLQTFATILIREAGNLLLEFLNLSYDVKKKIELILVFLVLSAIVLFQIILLTNYYLTRKENSKQNQTLNI